MIIAIDGPAGAGKSTVARAVAAALGLELLDTGAMYRAVAWRALAAGIDPLDGEGCARIASAIELSFDAQGRVQVDGHPAEPAIRGEAVTRAVSAVSAHPGVRAAIVPLQRARAAHGRGVVAEGRDIGTVVCPQAHVKVFLTASPEARARRRAEELGADYETVLAEQLQRDERDERREHSPLVPANDAVPVDTTELDLEGVLGQIMTLVVEAREVEA
jgi:cytidylate kinase